ncbi:hypothetical protein B0H34DRAFT_517899 [Crassisporium funariophilum]|nr:hypothetical protein B0H34DRAFT_517899 [Crassisporium funariophilum]
MAHNQNFFAHTHHKSLTEELNSPLANYELPNNLNPTRTTMFNQSENLSIHNDVLTSSNIHRNVSQAMSAPQTQDLQAILYSATHFALMAAGNEAHTGLFTDYMRTKIQLDAQLERVADLKEELKEARDSVKSIHKSRERDEESDDRESRRVSSMQQTIRIPMAPQAEEEEDYPDVRFWNKKDWTEFESRASTRNERVNRFGFLSDESGTRVSSERLKNMTETAKVAWNELYYWRLNPTTWTKRNDQDMQYFSATMCAKFPEFRWCQGDWKVQEFAKHKYPDWNRYSGQPGTLSRAKPSIGKRKADDSKDIAKPKKKRRNAPNHGVIDLTAGPSGCIDNLPAVSSSLISSSSCGGNIPLVSSPSPSRVDISDPSPVEGSQSNSPSAVTSSPVPVPVTIVTALQNAVLPNPDPPTTPTAIATPASNVGDHLDTEASPLPGPSVESTDAVQAPSPPLPAPSVVQAAQLSRRTRVNPLAGLAIPKPPSEVPQPESIAQPVLIAPQPKGKPQTGKPMEASSTSLTAQNLYAIDYLKENPDSRVTVGEFRKIYSKLDGATIKQYERLSKERKAAATKAVFPIPSSS